MIPMHKGRKRLKDVPVGSRVLAQVVIPGETHMEKQRGAVGSTFELIVAKRIVEGARTYNFIVDVHGNTGKDETWLEDVEGGGYEVITVMEEPDNADE